MNLLFIGWIIHNCFELYPIIAHVQCFVTESNHQSNSHILFGDLANTHITYHGFNSSIAFVILASLLSFSLNSLKFYIYKYNGSNEIYYFLNHIFWNQRTLIWIINLLLFVQSCTLLPQSSMSREYILSCLRTKVIHLDLISLNMYVKRNGSNESSIFESYFAESICQT